MYGRLTTAISAWAKFWLLAAGLLLYYALANQPKENLRIIVGAISFLTAGISVYFVLTYDWQNQPVDFQFLARLARWWMAYRPTLQSGVPSANTIGGLLAMLLPYPLVLGIHAWHTRQLLVFGFAGIISVVAFAGLIMTSSRAAWIALTIALGCWFLWSLVGWILCSSDRFKLGKLFNQRSIFLCCILMVAGITIVGISNSPDNVSSLFNSMPGVRDGSSRLALYKNSLSLLQDFIFTGGGLGAFAGLYSRYILVIPNFFFGYSHNLFLDLAIEQGVFGLGAFLVVFVASIWLLFGEKHIFSFRWAILASLIVIGLRGLLDDALYGEQGTPFLFLSIGLALAEMQSQTTDLKLASFIKRTDWKSWVLTSIGIVLIFVLISIWKPILARFYANLGAVQMARAELSDFPAGKWEDEHTLKALAPTKFFLIER